MIQVPLMKIWELDYVSKKNLKIIEEILFQRKLFKACDGNKYSVTLSEFIFIIIPTVTHWQSEVKINKLKHIQ